MNPCNNVCRPGKGRGVIALLLALSVAGLVAERAVAQDLEELLTQVGEDYAVSYLSPFLNSFGPTSNSNLYSTAAIPASRFVFGIGIKVAGAKISEADQTFAKVIENVDLTQYDPSLLDGTTGDVYLSGPTVMGDTETNGLIQGFVNGVEVFRAEGIPGLVDTRWSPMAAPEAYIGGVAGLRFTLRYLPEMDTGDYGKTKYMGWGLQWNLNGVLKTLPVDVMAGFFTQSLDVGTIYESNANSFFAAASKGLGPITAYGGMALENSDVKVAYDFIHPSDPNLNSRVAFDLDGIQDFRLTLGVTLNVLAKINLEAGIGNELTSYSAGLMFGL